MDYREKSALEYLKKFTHYTDHALERVKIHICEKYGPQEPFCLYWAKSVKPYSNNYYHVSYDQFNKLSENGGCCKIYGRSEWGPLVELNVEFYLVVSVRLLNDRELREAKLYLEKTFKGE